MPGRYCFQARELITEAGSLQTSCAAIFPLVRFSTRY